MATRTVTEPEEPELEDPLDEFLVYEAHGIVPPRAIGVSIEMIETILGLTKALPYQVWGNPEVVLAFGRLNEAICADLRKAFQRWEALRRYGREGGRPRADGGDSEESAYWFELARAKANSSIRAAALHVQHTLESQRPPGDAPKLKTIYAFLARDPSWRAPNRNRRVKGSRYSV